MTAADKTGDGSDPALPSPGGPDERPRVAWERIGDELRPYWPDDPATSAFPDDGRLADEAGEDDDQ